MMMRWKKNNAFCAAAVMALTVTMISAPTPATAQQCEEEGGRRVSQTLDPRIGQEIQKLYELTQAEQYQQALAGYNDLIARRGDSMKPYDKSTVYELRGGVKAALEDYRGALRDFQAALDAGGLPSNRNNQLRYFIAQLNFQIEQFQTAIAGLNNWIRFAQACGQPVDPSAYYLLAAAYVQIQPPNYRAALGPAEQAVAGLSEPNKSYYGLLNLVYSELNETTKRAALLERMINNWPSERSYWTQLSGAYSVLGQDRDAFSVMEVAYRAGLLSKESELLTLVQYYSFFENPYRGAKMLEREMAAGNVARSQKNLILLSQLWSQSREHKKSIPILREAAGQASTGELYYRLGQVLLADEQYAAAQRALERALNRGGMKRKDTGDAWLLLGTARFSQAGPEDTAIWASARQAFVNAQRYEGARRRATDWIAYIDAVVDTYRRGKEIERLQQVERCQGELDRIETQRRIRELRNQPPAQEELDQERRILAECAPFIDGLDAPEGAAAPAADDAGDAETGDDEADDGDDE